MNKQVIATSLLAALLIPTTNGFAQFKTASKSAKNLANLDRVVARATKKPNLLTRVLGYKTPGPTKLPSGRVVPGNAGLLRVKFPETITPVNKSYVFFVWTKYNGTVKNLTRTVLEDWINRSTHNSFYTQQEQLAQDLDAFYHGKADIFIGPDSRKVKLYALPANGILYKPAGYTTPLVLNSDDYFVIYDVVAKTGKIAENKPEVYNLFTLSPEYGKFRLYKMAGIARWHPVDSKQYYKWNRDLMPNQVEDANRQKEQQRQAEVKKLEDELPAKLDKFTALTQMYGGFFPQDLEPVHVRWSDRMFGWTVEDDISSLRAYDATHPLLQRYDALKEIAKQSLEVKVQEIENELSAQLDKLEQVAAKHEGQIPMWDNSTKFSPEERSLKKEIDIHIRFLKNFKLQNHPLVQRYKQLKDASHLQRKKEIETAKSKTGGTTS